MFDSKKIDSFFDKNSTFHHEANEKRMHRSFGVRFIKIGFPCLAAMILGVMVVLPNIRKHIDLNATVTLPKSSEIEKLHIETPILNITDAKNRVSTMLADTIDEVAPGADEIKAVNPRADIPTDNGVIKLSAAKGFFERNTKLLRLDGNVYGVDENSNKMETAQAYWDFEKDYGYGNTEVTGSGNWGNFKSEGFEYHKDKMLLVLKGKSFVESEKMSIFSNRKTKFFQKYNVLEAYNDVVIEQKGKMTLYADRIKAYFSGAKSKELKKADAVGNVKIITDKGTAFGHKAHYNVKENTVYLWDNVSIESGNTLVYASRAVYNTLLQKMQLFDKITIISDKAQATGDIGEYDAKNNMVDLKGNVTLEQDGNFIKGTHVHTDLNTSISTIVADERQNGRVFGTFYNQRKVKDE